MKKETWIRIGGWVALVAGVGAFVLQILAVVTDETKTVSSAFYNLKDIGWPIFIAVVGFFLIRYKPNSK